MECIYTRVYSTVALEPGNRGGPWNSACIYACMYTAVIWHTRQTIWGKLTFPLLGDTDRGVYASLLISLLSGEGECYDDDVKWILRWREAMSLKYGLRNTVVYVVAGLWEEVVLERLKWPVKCCFHTALSYIALFGKTST